MLFDHIAEIEATQLIVPLTYDGSGIGRGARFTGDRRHRLILDRHFDRGETAAFVGVNPSDAGEDDDDPTVRKLYGFGRRNGIGRWVLVNEFSLVSSDVKALVPATGPAVLPENNAAIRTAFALADRIVVGWGRLDKLPPALRGRWREIVAMAGDKPLWCFGTCDDGHPRHPARIAYDTPLERWRVPE